MSLRLSSLPASLTHKVKLHSLLRYTRSPLPVPFRHTTSRLHPALLSARRFHTSSFHSAVLSPPSASQSDPDATLHTPLSHDEAPTLKQALDPSLWFPDAEPLPAPPTADPTAPNGPSTAADGTTDGSVETANLYYTVSHPQLHPVAPIAEVVAPLPCAYTPPDIAPLMDVDDIKKAMESVIVSEEDDEARKAKEEEERKKSGVVEVKGLDELLEDVKAEEEEEEAKKGKALVVGT